MLTCLMNTFVILRTPHQQALDLVQTATDFLKCLIETISHHYKYVDWNFWS